MLMRVLDHDDCAVDHGADGDRDAAEAHDIGAKAEPAHRRERHQDADGQHEDRDKRAADVQKKDDAHQRDDGALLQERMLQGVDRRIDEVGAVVDRNDFRARGQARRQLRDPLLDVVDHVEGVEAEALQRDAARNLALAVEFGDAAPLIGSKFEASHIPQQDRRPIIDLHDDLAEIVEAAQIPLAAHDIFKLGKLQCTPADIGVAGANDLPDLVECDAEIAQPLRIDDHIVLLHEAARAGDLGHAFRLGQAIAQRPILDRARLREVQILGRDRVLIDPANAGCVGAKHRRYARWQARRRLRSDIR